MSMGANLSIMGLYNYDNSIFDLMAFPDDFTDAQKQTTVDNILIDCAELEILYPNPIIMKNIIGIWSRKEKPYWDRVYRASMAEYNPIENYRRNEIETVADGRTEQHSGKDVNAASGSDTDSRTGTETLNKTGMQSTAKTGTEAAEHEVDSRIVVDELSTDTLSGSDQLKKTGSDSNTASGSDTSSGSSSSTDTNSGTDTVTNKITGYDSNTLVTHDESDTVHGHVLTNAAQGSNTQQYGRVDTQTHNTTDTTEYGKVDTLDHDVVTTETHDDTDTTTYDTIDKTNINTQDQNVLNTLETFVHGKTDTLTHGEKIEHEGNTERSMLAYGNIGVTTSQEMLTQELELAKIIEVIPVIIESFKSRFCLMVY